MALTDEVRRIVEEYLNPRIDQLPFGLPEEGDYIPYWAKRRGLTMRLSASSLNPSLPSVAIATNFEWIPDRKDIAGISLPYALNDVVTRGGNWYQSKITGNNFTPGSNDTWELMTKSFSGGFWKAGLYTDERPWVFSNHSGFTQIYELVNAARPYHSTNIVNEENAGDWISMLSRLQVKSIDTSQQIIPLDFKNASEVIFKGDTVISQPVIWQVSNYINTVQAKFYFVIGTLDTHLIPNLLVMSDAGYDPVTQKWEPYDIGAYVAEINFFNIPNSGEGLFGTLKILGPFTGSNSMPFIFDNVITYNGEILDGPRTYFDPEGDLENNPKPQANNVSIIGTHIPGEILTIVWNFYSPSGYVAGIHQYQWYRQNEDGSNVAPISGQVNNIYTILETDVEKVITVSVIPLQTAILPANGNPEGLQVFSPGVLISPAPPTELDLATEYTHYLKIGTWDDVNKRSPDLGLSGGANFFAAPVGKLPVVQPDGSLLFNPDAGVQCLRFPLVAGGTSKTHEIVGVFTFTQIGGTKQSVSLTNNTYIQFQNTGLKLHVGFNGDIQFPDFDPIVNTPYAFRVRIYTTGTVHGTRLQINRSVEGIFEFDQDIQSPDRNGTTWIAQSGAIGSSIGELVGWEGKIAEIAIKVNSHLDPLLENTLWGRLNAVKNLI